MSKLQNVTTIYPGYLELTDIDKLLLAMAGPVFEKLLKANVRFSIEAVGNSWHIVLDTSDHEHAFLTEGLILAAEEALSALPGGKPE